jgi:hypothetical protein
MVLGLAVLWPSLGHAQSLTAYLDSPKYKATRAAGLDEELAQIRYMNCLAAEAERIGGSPQDRAAVAEKIHGRCPAEAAAYWSTHDRVRETVGGPAAPEDRSGLTFELNGALLGLMHQRLDEGEARRFEANLDVRARTGVAFAECMHDAALKADDHVSQPADIARKIVNACPAEETRDVDATVQDEPQAVAAKFREDHAVRRLQQAERSVELAREQPRYFDSQ